MGTRTLFVGATMEQRKAYRVVYNLFEDTCKKLKVGTSLGEIAIPALLESHEAQLPRHTRCKLELAVTAVSGGNDQGFLHPIAEDNHFDEGTYLVTAGLVPPAELPDEAMGAAHHLEPVWIQDTVWVQAWASGATLVLTQHAS